VIGTPATPTIINEYEVTVPPSVLKLMIALLSVILLADNPVGAAGKVTTVILEDGTDSP
jgi:hypothetical protein